MQRSYGLCAAALLIGLGQPSISSACECASPESDAEATTRASAVFIGEVQSIVPDFEPSDSDATIRKKARRQIAPDFGHDEILVTFRVLKPIKGASMTYLAVRTPAADSDCAFEFKTGRRYLVFADPWEGSLIVTVCTNTRLTNE